MGKFIKGDVVVVPFPFSDLSASKRRPALVISVLFGDDIILCQITSRSISDPYSIGISDADFETGSLRQESNVRPNRIFTADSNLILYQVGHIKSERIKEIQDRIIQIITS